MWLAIWFMMRPTIHDRTLHMPMLVVLVPPTYQH